jgi:hypothetical protein
MPGTAAVGFIACGISALFFGSNFIPVKKYQTGDGLFFQWVMCMAIFCVGFCVQLYRGSAFEPYAALGGFFWATGNVMCVPVIKMIGLGLGMLVWGVANLLTGWLSARFGFMGIDVQEVADLPLSIAGVCIITSSLGLMYFIETTPQTVTGSPRNSPSNYEKLESVNSDPGDAAPDASDGGYFARMPVQNKSSERP